MRVLSPLLLLLALVLPSAAPGQAPPAADEPASADSAANGVAEAGERATGRIPEEMDAFRETQERFAARMQELEDDTRAFVDRREREERERVSEGYDELLGTLGDLEETHRKMAVERMERFLDEHPDARYASHVRFRLADFYFEEAKERWLEESAEYGELEAELGFERMDELPPMPEVDLSKPIALYQRIIADNRDLARHRQYEHLDGVYYMLGFSYNEPNSAQRDQEQAREVFADLLEVRPESDLADVAHLFIGNYHFDKNEFERAIEEYRAVFDEGPEGLYYSEAVYQLAWAYYKLAGPQETALSQGPAAYDKALDLFTLLLDDSATEYEETGRHSDYRPDAIQYVAVSLFEMSEFRDESPRAVAEQYFAAVGGRAWEPDIYESLASVLESQARWDEAIAIYRKLQDDPRWRSRPENPEYQMQIVKLHASKRPPDLEASAAARVALTERYHSDGEWAAANRDHPDALATARGFIEDSLADVAIEYRIKANETGERADYLRAAERFRAYLEKFPIADDYYQQQWYLADTLYRAGEYDQALTEYESLIDSGRYHDFDDGAAYFAMDANLQRLAEQHTPPAVPERALAQELLADARSQGAPVWMVPRERAAEASYDADGQQITVYALSDDHQRFVGSAERLLDWQFSDPEDAEMLDFGEVFAERRHKVEYLIAQMLYFHNRYDEARPRLMAIIEGRPDTNEAAFAAGLLVDSYQNEGDLAQVRLYTRKFMSMQLGEDQELIGKRQEQFADLLEGTAFKEALAYVEQGDREAAAEAFLAFTEEFPDSEHVKSALYNAANSYEIIGRAERANELFREYVERYPEDERSKALYFRIAANYESTFELEKAIDYYGRLVERFGDDPDAADALYNASFLRIGLGDHEGAAQGFERYAAMFPDASDREEVFFQAGEQWEQVGDREARRFYERYLREYGLEHPDHALDAKYELAMIWERAGNQRRSDRYLEEIQADYAELSAQGAELGWASSHRAAEAAFAELQEAFEDVTDDVLSGNEKRDIELLMDEKPLDLDAFEKQALSIVQTYGDFEYTTASLYLLASAYLYYADLGFSLQPPPGLSMEEEDVYWEVLETEVFPQFYTVQDKAIGRFEALIELSRERKQYSEWVGKAWDRLNALDPRGYPQEKLELQGEVEAEIEPAIRPLRMEPPAPQEAP